MHFVFKKFLLEWFLAFLFFRIYDTVSIVINSGSNFFFFCLIQLLVPLLEEKSLRHITSFTQTLSKSITFTLWHFLSFNIQSHRFFEIFFNLFEGRGSFTIYPTTQFSFYWGISFIYLPLLQCGFQNPELDKNSQGEHGKNRESITFANRRPSFRFWFCHLLCKPGQIILSYCLV